MKAFMDSDFLLSTPTAACLYHDYAVKMPIIDYHCHVSPKEIYEDKHFDNITQVWLGGDHYKWRVMRSNGVDEYYITGGASDREKFQKFAEALPRAIGNPMYHWCHLELKTYFGYEGVLNGDTAEEVWNLANSILQRKDMGVRGLIKQSNVFFIGTTDDPADSLEWHKKLAEDPTLETKVAPSFRPDKALNIEKAGWHEYLQHLSEVAGKSINNLDALKSVLADRIALFDALGCRASDHGLDRTSFRFVTDDEVQIIMNKALSDAAVTADEADAFRTHMLLFCAREYARLGWAMQLHFNVLRNPNTRKFENLGPDTGFDCIGPYNGIADLTKLLDMLYQTNQLPRTILYSLTPSDNASLAVLIGAFQGTEVAGKLQHGSAWWFNDNKQGMYEQLVNLANLSLLGNFVGMLTDSRSFLSYTRHEYFRRILCDLIGTWIENGEYPADMDCVGKLVQDISFNNAKRYFRL